MKTSEKNSKKDTRIVVRVDSQTAEWLSTHAERQDSSVGRIIRMAIRRFQKEPNAASFNEADCQQVGLAA